jgi:alkylation response protein AidB-like acyl-CoA dehydrogenase
VLERSERQLIGDSARGFLDGAGGVARVRARRNVRSLDRAVWTQMAALGWFGMLVPEAQGGSGLVMTDMLELFHALGASLAPDPVAPVTTTACALAQVGTDEAAGLLEAIIKGDAVALFVPRAGAKQLAEVSGGRLNRGTGLRTDLHAADSIIFTARTSDYGVALFHADCGQPGIEKELRDTVDGGATGRVRFHDVDMASIRLLAHGVAAWHAERCAADVERLANAAMLTGVMDRALAMAVDYLGTRQQFGKPIGSFQALQHRAASCHVDVAAGRAIVREAALAWASPRQRGAAAAAFAYVSEAALRVTREAIQFHGAIGFTDGHDIGLFHRRALALAASGGGPAAARRTWFWERENFGLERPHTPTERTNDE